MRTMNVLNKTHFSDAQLSAGAEAAFQSLSVGSIWIVGRTLESDFSNLGRSVLYRIGNGSEMEEFVNRTNAGRYNSTHS